jgi:hypothetical protein
MTRPKLRIAILGTRGIPANYGGFETFAEELSTRLVQRGHNVTVYCRPAYTREACDTYQGVCLVVLPTIRHKYFDTVVHSFVSTLDAVFRRFDIILTCNSANSPFCWIPRVFGTKVVLNVDGLEWRRRKWNALGRAYYHVCEHLALWTPTECVSDALTVQEYYRNKYGADLKCIAYGARTLDRDDAGTALLDQNTTRSANVGEWNHITFTGENGKARFYMGRALERISRLSTL